jgi:hypothetical protein
VLTPTGYRCKDCVRGQQKVFETARPLDYVLAFVVGAVLSYIGSVIADVMGFFTLFIAPIAGVVTAEAIRWVVRRRRSRALFQLATFATVLGALPNLLMTVLGLVALSAANLEGGSLARYGTAMLFNLIWPLVYIILVASTVYYRLRGIQIR